MSRSKNSAYDTKEPHNSNVVTTQEEFRNSGYNSFLQIQQEWKTGTGRFTGNPSANQRGYNPQYQQQVRRRAGNDRGAPTAANINEDEVIERLFNGNGTLPESIPLEQMVDILVEVWEEEGLMG
jgi:hypothetical protein